MGHQRRGSKVLNRVAARIAALETISPDLDLGNGLSLAECIKKFTIQQERLKAYNDALAQLDADATFLNEGEKELIAYVVRMFAGVAAHYGRDSNEYALAGGVRNSDRKPYVRKSKKVKE